VTVIARLNCFVTACRRHTSYYNRYTIWVGFVFSNLLHLIEICRLCRDYCGVVGGSGWVLARASWVGLGLKVVGLGDVKWTNVHL